MNFVSHQNFSKNVSLAWPLALNSILVQSMVLVDLMLVAPLGEISIAALGISSAMLAFLIGIQYALANGTQLLIARSVGAGDPTKISTTMVIGWIINLGFSSLTFAILFFSSHALLNGVMDDPAIVIEAQAYLRTSLFMLIASSFSQIMIAYYNGNGKTKIPLYGFVLEIPFNVVISLVLIHGYLGFPALGLQGAAYGSLFAVCIRVAYLFLQLSRDRTIEIRRGFTTLTSKLARQHFFEIYPIAANFVTLTSGVMVHQLLFAQLDIYSYAAITLVMPWMQMGAQFVTAWAHATAINVSQFLGSQDTQSIPEFVTHAVRIILVLAVGLCLLFLVFSQILPMLYPTMEEQTQRALAMIAPIYILLPLVRTYNGLCGNTLRALGRSLTVLRIHVVTQWLIGIPFLVLLIYAGAPLWLVFGVILIEECLKVFYFRNNLRQQLAMLATDNSRQ